MLMIDIMFHIRVYGVADKYDVPQLRHRASNLVLRRIRDLFGVIDDSNITIIREGFQDIIRKIYQLTAASSNGELRSVISSITMEHRNSQVVGKPGALTSVVVELSKEIAEFGQDLFLAIVEITGRGGWALNWTTQHQCPSCQNSYYKDIDGGSALYCPFCGRDLLEPDDE